MFSRYLRTLSKEGVIAAYHELHPDPIFYSDQEWKDILAGRGDNRAAAQLVARGLLLEAPHDDDNEFRRVETELLKKLSVPTILYLMTAQGCNYGCGYCPVPEIAKRHGEHLLTTAQARAGIDLWQAHVLDHFDPEAEYFVIFYGGEPLLNKPVIEDSLRYIAAKKQRGELPGNIASMVATNGSLVDERFVEMCFNYEVMVAVGLDGPKGINDALKVTSSGDPTFDQVVDAINMLVAGGIRTFASATITPFNIDDLERFGDFFKGLGVEKFGFNFLKGNHLVGLVGSSGIEQYYRRASRGIIALNRHVDGEYQMQKKTLAFESGDFFPVDCTCYGNQLVVQPDGQISHCPFHKANLGDVAVTGRDFRIAVQPVVAEWRERLPLYHPGYAKALSGGGCAWGSIDRGDDPRVPDPWGDIFAEEVLHELIWSRYVPA